MAHGYRDAGVTLISFCLASCFRDVFKKKNTNRDSEYESPPGNDQDSFRLTL